MKTLFLFLSFLLIHVFSNSQTFGNLLETIASYEPAVKQKALDDYFSRGTPVPVLEGKTTVYFIYKGSADSVSVAGDATAWAPTMPLAMIQGTTYWYCQASYERAGRLEYKIVVNGKDWILDPLNANIVNGGMGQNSELLMPEYQPPLYIYERDAVPWGTYSDTLIHSEIMEEDRKFRIFLPAGYEKGTNRYPVAYFHDGFELFDRAAVRNILDNMVFEKKIRPVIAVFVQPVHRDEEYSGRLQGKYTRFMFDELIPFIDKGYRTLSKPENRAQFGISNGGNIALWLTVSNPKQNSLVAALSTNVESNIYKKFGTIECIEQKIYLDLGTYDIPFLIPKVKNLKALLERKGCNMNYHEYPEGHNWKFWQKDLPEAFEYLFPNLQ